VIQWNGIDSIDGNRSKEQENSEYAEPDKLEDSGQAVARIRADSLLTEFIG
jgi:hypothetical protein